ncbi:hypothetical protein KAT84_00845 [Candidatus Bipolaricaulota bacterium]|nr:hypothetical protein [Candidatus Bipolaricaulota bacterium]
MGSPSNLITRLKGAIQAAHAAGDILHDGFHSGVIAYDTKSNRNDPVTEFDLRADRAIVAMVRGNFPHDDVFTEERGRSTNYQGQPFSGTSSSIVASNSQLHNPILSHVEEGRDGEQ